MDDSSGKRDSEIEPSREGLREVGHFATWTVSGAKPGCGVKRLRDGKVT